MALPPIHNPTNPIVYIARADTAWDMDRINYELEVLDGDREADEDRPVVYDRVQDHPVMQYRLGDTRYDVATVRGYLLPDDKPVEFHLRRLSRSQRNNLLALQERGQAHNAFEAAFRLGLRRITGADIQLQLRVQKQKMVSDADMKRIEAVLGRDIFHEVGEAVMRASRDLTRAEAKPSDCGPGSSE